MEYFLDRSPGSILLELYAFSCGRSYSHVRSVLPVSDLAISSIIFYFIPGQQEEMGVEKQVHLAEREIKMIWLAMALKAHCTTYSKPFST